MKYILLFLLTLTLSGCGGLGALLNVMIVEQEKAEARCLEKGGNGICTNFTVNLRILEQENLNEILINYITVTRWLCNN